MAAKPRLTLTLSEDINDFLDDLKSDFSDSDLSENVSGDFIIALDKFSANEKHFY